MKTMKQIVLCGLVSAVLIPGVADAQTRPWHVSIEGGLADANLERFSETWDEALQLQASLGYDLFTGSWGVLTGEFALGTSISEGDFDHTNRRRPNGRRLPDLHGEWDVTTIGLFLTYRTDEVVVYPLARVGVQHSDLSNTVPLLRLPDSDNRGGDDTGLAAGFGAGFRFTRNAALELSWTRHFSFLDEDLDVVALGVRF